MIKSITTREQEIEAAAQNLDKLTLDAAEFSGGVDLGKGFSQNIKMAKLIQALQDSIRPVMPTLMPLMNTSLGFKTDKDPTRPQKQKDGSYAAPKPYTEEQLVPVIAEAIIRGVNVTGNQFNVIAGACYITKEGFEYKLKNLEGFTDLQVDFDVPRDSGAGCIIKSVARWNYHGKPGELAAEIPVKKNEFLGIDALYGKAKRKLLSRVWERVTNSSIPDGDASEYVEVEGVQINRPKFEPPPRKVEAQDAITPADDLMARIMESGIDPKFFEQAFRAQKYLVADMSIPQMTAESINHILSKWPSVEKFVRALEGGGK